MHECAQDLSLRAAPHGTSDTTQSHNQQCDGRTTDRHDPEPVLSTHILTTQISKAHVHAVLPYLLAHSALQTGHTIRSNTPAGYHQSAPRNAQEQRPHTHTSFASNSAYLLISTYPAHRTLTTPTDFYKSHRSSLCNIPPSYIPSPS